jgi:hypothetical protein
MYLCPNPPLRPITPLLIQLLIVVRPQVVIIPCIPHKDRKAWILRLLRLLRLVPARIIRNTLAPRRVVRRRCGHGGERGDPELWSLRSSECGMSLRNRCAFTLDHDCLLILVFIHNGAQIGHLQAFEKRLEAHALLETSAC